MKTNEVHPLTIKIQQKPASYDHDVVFFKRGDFKVGSGYRSREDQKICIQNCPKCYKENYEINISTGTCSFCGYDPNEEFTNSDESIKHDIR